jgi:hypothetical protein
MRQRTVACILIQRAIFPLPCRCLEGSTKPLAESLVFETAFDEHPDDVSDFLSHVIFYA